MVASWPLGWLATWAVVGVNADMGFSVFGASGALLVTALTGLALRPLLAAPGATGDVLRPASAASA